MSWHSVLSPIYMRPLNEIVQSTGDGCHKYADDTQLYQASKCICLDSEPVFYDQVAKAGAEF